MRHALKEAGLQNQVLTNRNGIRGYGMRISKHIIATSIIQNHSIIDATRHWRKEKALTRGDLVVHELAKTRGQQKP